MDVTKWLLHDSTPAVKYAALYRLHDGDPASRKMRALRKECNRYPPVAKMLDRVEDAIAAGNYRKYRGAFWTLIFLSEMYADGRDKRARKLADHVLSVQLPNGGFSASKEPRFEVICLTANILRSLVTLGYAEHESVIRGYRRLAERILPAGGLPCVALYGCLHTSCKMTLPQTLRCIAVAPPGVPKREVKRLRDLLVKQLLAVRGYRYVRPDAKEYRAASKQRPKGTTLEVFKADWLAKHKVKNEDLQPKKRWLRFGFPRSYNPDLLEAMLALAEAGVGHRPILDDALDHIEKKRSKDGRWKLEDSLNGKMLADVERKGRPSKWVTLRAMYVLKHFGRLEVR